jgi:hypothetical protein
MKMIQRRKWIEETMGIVFFAVGVRHPVNDCLAILNNVPVAVNDRVPVKTHDFALLDNSRSSRRAIFVKTSRLQRPLPAIS